MGRPGSFLAVPRLAPPGREPARRVADSREFAGDLAAAELAAQAGRCLDCGLPFCHLVGCPLGNRAPDVHEEVGRGRWRQALEILHESDNFPEFTGRLCPAPCEAACTLALGHGGVTIRQIERQLVERGFAEGWVAPRPAGRASGRTAQLVGSGPAALAAAQQLARAGHQVTVYEKAPQPGGLLRYGIPDYKLEKRFLDRRLAQLRAEGVRFLTGVEAGVDLSARHLRRTGDALILAPGCGAPRDLSLPGRELAGIHFAVDFLAAANRRQAGEERPGDRKLDAAGLDVVVIGGGDTGADCVGVARRQGAGRIVQLELLPEPPAERAPDNPWPEWPRTRRDSSSHEEGCERLWSVQTGEFLGAAGRVRALRAARLEWADVPGGRPRSRELPGSEFELEASLVLLALGFTGPERGPLVRDLELALDARGCLVVDADLQTAAPGVFAAGDAVSGPALVAAAIAQGRKAAEAVARYLAR